MSRKILFFDIDETLMDGRTQKVPDTAIEAITKAHDKGHLIFINTGRCKSFIPACLQEVPIDGFCYACGSHIEYQGKTLFEKFVAMEDITYIMESMKEAELQGIFQGPDFCYFDDISEYYSNFANFLKMYDRDYKVERKSFYDENLQVNKLVTFREDNCDYASFVQKTKDKYQLIDNGGGFTEILPLPYTKASCMDFLMDYFSIAQEDCYVFGDSPNDVPMMEHIKNSIAMGNAYPSIKEISGYVTSDIDKDGVKNALEHFQII